MGVRGEPIMCTQAEAGVGVGHRRVFMCGRACGRALTQLGCAANPALPPGTYPFGSGPIHLDDVLCSGYEASLSNCVLVRRSGWGSMLASVKWVEGSMG